jgi:hypothetical protein
MLPIIITKNSPDALLAFVDPAATGFKQAWKPGKVNKCLLEERLTFRLLIRIYFGMLRSMSVLDANS